MISFQALNSVQKSWQVALAVSFALVSAFLPFVSFINLFILIVVFSINVPIFVYFIFIALFTLLSILFEGVFHSLGFYVLNMSGLQDFWSDMYNYAPALWSNFNYTSTMGGFIVSMVLFLPIFFVFKFFIDRYRVVLSNTFKNSKWFSWLNPFNEDKQKENAGIFRLWGGLLVVLIVSLLLSFFLLILDPIIKYSLEYSLSKSTNFVVDIDEVDSDILNTSLSIKKVTIYADENVIFINDIFSKLNFKHLIHKKIDIETLSFGNIIVRESNKLDAIKMSKIQNSKQKDDNEPSSFNINLPSIDDILDKEDNLESIKEADSIKKDIERIKTKWVNIKDNDKYNKDIENIKKQIAQLAKEVQNIKNLNDMKNVPTTVKNISSDILSLKSRLNIIYKEYQKDKSIINQYMQSIKSLPSQDFNNIKNKYSFDESGAINFVETHISNALGEYIKVALKYYKIIKPYIKDDNENKEAKAMQGEWITYKEKNPYPVFVIRNIDAHLNIQDLNYSLYIKDISSNQKKYKKIMKARLAGEDKQYKKLILDYEHNSMNKESLGTLKLDIDSYKIKSYKPRNDLIMKDMSINSKGLGYINDLQTIEFDIRTDITEILFEYKSSDSIINNIIYSLLKNINSFDVNIKFKGDIENPSINVNSNLDIKIAQSLVGAFDKQRNKFEEKLKLKLQEKMNLYIKTIDINNFNSIDGIFKNNLNKSSGLNDILSKIQSNNKFKKQIENKVKKQLGNMFKSLF